MKTRLLLLLTCVSLVMIAIMTILLWQYADVWWPGTLLMFSPRSWVPVLFLPLIVWAVVARKRRPLIMAIVAGWMAWIPFSGYVINPLAAFRPDEGPERLRIVTLNADGKSLDKAVFTSFLKEYHPDIVLMQDAGSYGVLAAHLPEGWHVASGTGNLRGLSPTAVHFVEEYHEPAFGPGRGGARFRFETPFGDVVAVNIHQPTPRDGLEALINRAPKALTLIDEDSEVRTITSRKLGTWADNSADLIIAGDFNCPVESRIYRRDWSRFQNAFNTAGFGWGYTMYTGKAAMRIDHVLYKAPWKCVKCWVGPHVGSAHRPVIADLVLTFEGP